VTDYPAVCTGCDDFVYEDETSGPCPNCFPPKPVRNQFVITPGVAHIAVDDPVSATLSLETKCGRSLVDGLTWDFKAGEPIQTLDNFPGVARCSVCFGLPRRRKKLGRRR
jgi:hypothetical protein